MLTTTGSVWSSQRLVFLCCNIPKKKSSLISNLSVVDYPPTLTKKITFWKICCYPPPFSNSEMRLQMVFLHMFEHQPANCIPGRGECCFDSPPPRIPVKKKLLAPNLWLNKEPLSKSFYDLCQEKVCLSRYPKVSYLWWSLWLSHHCSQYQWSESMRFGDSSDYHRHLGTTVYPGIQRSRQLWRYHGCGDVKRTPNQATHQGFVSCDFFGRKEVLRWWKEVFFLYDYSWSWGTAHRRDGCK